MTCGRALGMVKMDRFARAVLSAVSTHESRALGVLLAERIGAARPCSTVKWQPPWSLSRIV